MLALYICHVLPEDRPTGFEWLCNKGLGFWPTRYIFLVGTYNTAHPSILLWGLTNVQQTLMCTFLAQSVLLSSGSPLPIQHVRHLFVPTSTYLSEDRRSQNSFRLKMPATPLTAEGILLEAWGVTQFFFHLSKMQSIKTWDIPQERFRKVTLTAWVFQLKVLFFQNASSWCRAESTNTSKFLLVGATVKYGLHLHWMPWAYWLQWSQQFRRYAVWPSLCPAGPQTCGN